MDDRLQPAISPNAIALSLTLSRLARISFAASCIGPYAEDDVMLRARGVESATTRHRELADPVRGSETGRLVDLVPGGGACACRNRAAGRLAFN